MATPVVTSITPGLGRAASVVVIAGTDFLASGNAVTFDGVAATISVESTTSITCTVNGPLTIDEFVPVVVTASGTFTTHWWSRNTEAALKTLVLQLQQRGPAEANRDFNNRPVGGLVVSPFNPDHVEAKDYTPSAWSPGPSVSSRRSTICSPEPGPGQASRSRPRRPASTSSTTRTRRPGMPRSTGRHARP